jgi:hypothetical protein
MKALFLFLFLMSCSAPISNYNVDNEILDFDKDLTFNEFNELIIKYAKTTPYPNIDQ